MKNKIKKSLTFIFFLSMICTISFAEDALYNYTVEDLEKHYSPYQDEYRALMDDGHTTYLELFNYLDEWLRNDEDAEVYTEAAVLFEYLAKTKGTIPDVEIKQNNAFSIIPDPNDETNNLFVYRDKVLNFKQYLTAVSYLNEAISKYTNRFDLWDLLVTTYEDNYLFPDEAHVLIALLDFVDYMEEIEGNWYLRYNEKLEIIDGATFDDFLYDYYTKCLDTMMGEYRDYISVREVFDRALERWEDDSYLLSELGYTYIFSDPDLAVYYNQLAFDSSSDNINAVLNILLVALMTEDDELLDTYKPILYDSENEEAIQIFETNASFF